MIHTIEASLIVLAALLLWQNVFPYGVSVPAAEASIGIVGRRAVLRPLPAPAADVTDATIGTPMRINIPRIRVNAAIRPVGLAPDGSMGVPKVPRDTAWYMLGPKPGETGSAVIAGHVNWLYGATGAFERLNTLAPGDVVDVQYDNKAIVSFVVRESKVYDAAADATEVFNSHDDGSHLNLVTCDGVWDKRAKQYTKRLVVFTDKK